jgi:tetratricopeptide (TPR) repeat protein
MTESMYQTHITHYTSDSDNEDDDHLNINKIEYNKYVLEGIAAFNKRDYSAAIKSYEQALKAAVTSNELEKVCSVKSNLAIIYFYSNDFKRSLSMLDEAARGLRDIKNKGNLTDSQTALLVRILSNLCALNLFLNKFEESKDSSNEIISLISLAKDGKKKALLEDLVFMLFRFKSFESMGEGYFENLETKYEGETLGCLYLILGVNREILNDLQLSVIYYKKSFAIWKNLNDKLFMILTAKHVINVAQLTGQAPDVAEYSAFLKKLFGSEDLRNISPEILFKDFERRIAFAREITASLKKLEDSNITSFKQETLRKSVSTKQLEEINMLGEPLWKQALRLKLAHSIRLARNLQKSTKDSKEQEHLNQAVAQMQKTQEMLQDEKNPMIENRIQTDTFTKDAVSMLKAKLNILRKVILNHSFVQPFIRLHENKDKESRLSVIAQERNKVSNLMLRAEMYVRKGDFLTKVNFGSSGKKIKFFRVCEDNVLRWGDKEADLKNPAKKHTVYLSEVKGVIYGKKSETFVKSGNKALLPWYCMTLKLQNRTLDFYLKPEQATHWVIGLSYLVKKQNPQSACLRPGHLLWRKAKMIGMHKIGQHFIEKKKSVALVSLTRSLIALKKEMLMNASAPRR